MDLSSVFGNTASGAMAGAPGGLPGALIGGGAGLLGSLLQSNGANQASEQAAQAQQQALEFAKQQYAQGRTDLAPWMQAGSQAAGQLGGIASQAQPGFDYQQHGFDFQMDPGTQVMMQEAAKALNASSLAKGGFGGGAAKAMQTEIQNMANTGYNNAFGRYMDTSNMLNNQAQQKYARNLGWQQNQFGQQAEIAGMGQGAAQGLAGMGQQLGQYGGNMIAGAGQSRATGTMGGANAWANGVGNLGANLARGIGGNLGGGQMGGNQQLPQNKFGQVDWGEYANNAPNLMGGY